MAKTPAGDEEWLKCLIPLLSAGATLIVGLQSGKQRWTNASNSGFFYSLLKGHFKDECSLFTPVSHLTQLAFSDFYLCFGLSTTGV